jgi:hypothetical protein
MISDTVVTFTDSNICTIAIGKAITFNIEMYQGDTKIMESNKGQVSIGGILKREKVIVETERPTIKKGLEVQASNLG